MKGLTSKNEGVFQGILFILMASLLVLGYGVCARAAVFHVTTGADFQTVLATAETNGEDDTIYLAAGTYSAKTDGTYGFDSAENYDLTVTHEAEVTPSQVILDGGNAYPSGTDGVPVMRFDMTGSGNMIIDGITIQNGYTHTKEWHGGGLWISMGTGAITVKNCVFKQNKTENNGGGFYIKATKGSVTISGNTILNNTAGGYGGGFDLQGWGDAYNVGTVTIEKNIVQNNTAIRGGGFNCGGKSPIYILNNTVENNIANGAYVSSIPSSAWYGGGAFKAVCWGSEFVVKNNIIRNNTAQNKGGGIYCGKSSDGDLTVANNLIAGNTVIDNHSGGLYAYVANEADGNGVTGPFTGSLRVLNNTIAYNTAQKSSEGGGCRLFVEDETWSAAIYNNIVYGNTAHGEGQDIFIKDVDTNANNLYGPVTLHNNDYSMLGQDPSTFTIDLKDNINQDPRFLASNDYHLQYESPCIDTGSNAAVPLGIIRDLDGNPRIIDGNLDGTGTVDMGAYEVFPTRVLSLWPVKNAWCGHNATLWAQVQNTGASTLPADAVAWFWVTGPSWSGAHWVGSAPMTGLEPNGIRWYSYIWAIPAGASDGTYTYWVRNFMGNTAISPWSSPQTFIVSCGSLLTEITSLWKVDNARCNHNATLWAQVKNIGTATLPTNASVWFYVNGPSWSGSHWVGYASVAGLAPGASGWYFYGWAIPSGASGTYTYWTRVFDGSTAISAWSVGQTFSVTCPSALVLSLYQVTNAKCGQSATLWAEVKNTGASNLPADATVWFWVSGPNWSGSNWVGYASVADLAPGTSSWYYYRWAIPSGYAGTYTYWAQVWLSGRAISPWSTSQGFAVYCP